MHSGNQLSSPTQIGPSNGKRVLCSSQALPIFNNLVKLAQSGNHWAGLIVRGVQGLSSGRLHLDNIYIEKKASLAYGKGAFHIVLPGVTASLEEHPNGSYILQQIKVDGNYQKLQEDSLKPGLWRVGKVQGALLEHLTDGKILNEKFRPVIISDIAKADARGVAGKIRKDLIKTNDTIKTMVDVNGFDMHYTPGNNGIVGLKKARSALATSNDRDITQSAMLLANTMYQARSIPGVMWYSDWGGSAVLTRAMEILHHEKNISLNSHAIFMNRPTSRASYALELGKKLGLKSLGKGKKAGWNYKELAGTMNISEVSTKGTQDAAEFSLSASGAAFGIAGALGLVSGPAAVAGMLVGVVGGMHYVTRTVQSAIKNLPGKPYK